VPTCSGSPGHRGHVLIDPDLQARIRAWTFDDALPFWLENSVDRQHGGFIETLDFQGRDAGSPFKRVRVACRQVYVYSHAATLGWDQGLEAAVQGGRDLLDQAWRDDGAGFVRRLTPQGAVLDPTIDLYDNAFGLFALAWLYRASGETWARDAARRTLASARQVLSHPGGEGYWHDETRAGPRLQNPHMHLTEACIVAYDATADADYLDEALRIASLFRRRFFDGETLGEFFSDDWARVPGETGRITEPGHQMEWAWILAALQQRTGEDLSGTIASLIARSEATGVDPASGATFNAVRDDGTILDAGSRTWPNTERLKAAVAAQETLGQDAGASADAAIRILLDRYLAGPIPGGWIDAFDSQGRPLVDVMPTSTLYHVFLAFAEAMRVWPSTVQSGVRHDLGQG